MKTAIAAALEKRGYTTLTPVQQAVTDPDLTGADLLVSAQTGSGKTLGFGLAIAPTLLGEAEAFEPAGTPLALVIAPTRELALQVRRELAWLFAEAGAVLASCVGGMDMRDERRALARGAHIVVATPGRLRDHIMRGSIDLGDLRSVVLDEADEMLDLGFREDLEFILGEAPQDRQTLLFSATVPRAIASLAQKYQRDAVRVSTKAEQGQHADIDYQAMTVAERDSENAIINVLRFFEAANAIVFCNTRAAVNRLTTRLSNRGFSVVALSGELSQTERTHALQAMRDGRARVCVATDVAARGIDLPNLDLVVHAELPTGHETLLHRSGRTGRAGRKGVSALIVTPKSRKKAERLLKTGKLRAEWTSAPSAEAVRARDQARMLADPGWAADIGERDRDAVAALVESFTPEQLAAGYLRAYHASHTAPEELGSVDAPAERRAPFGPSVWFSIPGGHDQKAEPRRLLPMLCKAGNLTKDDIGAIRIRQDFSVFEIREESVAAFLEAIGPGMAVEGGKVLTQLAAPPVVLGSADAPRKPASRKPGPRKSQSKAARYQPRDDVPANAAASPAPDASPIDWNDDPAPRVRKPKPGQKPGPKPKRKPAEAEEAPRHVVKPSRRRADGKPKGPPPPVGKASSKKNKARAKAAAAAKAAARRGSGGTTPPKRKRT